MMKETLTMKYKQIVFDIDGTLIDTEYAVIHSLQDTIAHLTGKNLTNEELIFILGITGEDALRRLNIKNIEEALSLWDNNMKKYSRTVCVFNGIHELLKALIKSGYEPGIVTSKTKKEFEHDFMVFDIASLFKTIICADDTAKHKPDPEPLLKYMELTKCSGRELLYIGDSIYDMECAKRAGTDFSFAQWGIKRTLNSNMASFVTPFDAIDKLIGK